MVGLVPLCLFTLEIGVFFLGSWSDGVFFFHTMAHTLPYLSVFPPFFSPIPIEFS